MPRIPKYTDPIRFPQYADQDTRDVRGWILLVCTVLLPGSVQSLFGSDTSQVAFHVEVGAHPKFGAVAGLTVITVGALEDLPSLMRGVSS